MTSAAQHPSMDFFRFYCVCVRRCWLKYLLILPPKSCHKYVVEVKIMQRGAELCAVAKYAHNYETHVPVSDSHAALNAFLVYNHANIVLLEKLSGLNRLTFRDERPSNILLRAFSCPRSHPQLSRGFTPISPHMRPPNGYYGHADCSVCKGYSTR